MSKSGAKRLNHTGLSRRSMLQGASIAAVATAATLGQETPAMAQGLQAAFAPPPSGGDDTALLKDALAYGKILGPGCYISEQPLDGLSTLALMAVPGCTAVQVNGSAFVDSTGGWTQLYIDGIDFECSSTSTSTVIRNRSLSPNVTRHKVIKNCYFHNYIGPAISLNQTDNPYIKIDGCTFVGKSSVTSVGIALAAGNDESLISNCDFLVAKHGIVLGSGGSRVRIRDCEFVHFEGGSNRVDVWIQPTPSYVNSGPGLAISDNKFGNEHRDATDFYVLYADSGSGLVSGAKWVGDFAPKLSSSQGWASLQRIQHNDISGAGSTVRPTVVSYTPNIIGSLVGPNFHSGTIAPLELFFAGGKPTSPTGTRVDAGLNQDPGATSSPTTATNASSAYVKIIS